MVSGPADLYSSFPLVRYPGNLENLIPVPPQRVDPLGVYEAIEETKLHPHRFVVYEI